MSEPECPLTELPASQCACRKHRGGHAPGDPDPGVHAVGHTWTAMFGGPCAAGCRGIRIDDEIGRTADGDYAHAEGGCRS